jgi:hypothetical protein
MRRFLTLVCLLCLAIPAGISITGCTRNPAAQYCNGVGYGLKITDVSSIIMQPQTAGISLAFGQTQQANAPTGYTCKGGPANTSGFTYGTTNNQLVDISPTGLICAGTWNRNTGGGIPNYTVCNKPDPLPSTGGLPYGIAYITAEAQGVTSNPVEVRVHAQATSITLVTVPVSGVGQQCFSQGQIAQLDAQACFAGANNQQQLLCAPPSVTTAASPSLACPLPPGVSLSSIPDCTVNLGTLNFAVGTSSIATINPETEQITAQLPGTTPISASVSGSGSSAGYFSTCPPQSISLTLENGATTGTVTQGFTQNLTTTIIDTQGNPITGLTLDYQSTDPIDITTGTGGSIQANFAGTASVYGVCQPTTCNQGPINEVGLYGTGLSVTSNPVTITVPGTASDYIWFAAPGLSQYFVPIQLLTGNTGSNVRLPYVPNSMVMDRNGVNLYFGSSHELMVYTTNTNTLSKQDPSAPGVVLAVAPSNSTLLINDQQRQVFYIYNTSGGISATFGGLGNAAAWTPDSKTLYVTDNAALNNASQGITGHTDTLYVYNVNSGWTTYPLPPSPLPEGSQPSTPPGSLPWDSLPPNAAVASAIQTPAIAIPSVGAYLRGYPTVAHTWCPSGQVGDYASMIFYPQGPPPDNSVDVQSDVLTATTDGKHILGATTSDSNIDLSDIGVTLPQLSCLPPASDNNPLAAGDPLLPMVIDNTVNSFTIPANASAVNQVVVSPGSNLAFVTYNPALNTNTTALPFYEPGTGGAAGTVGSVTLGGSAASSITAPIAGAFSPDSSYFFVSTAGDNMIHYISVPEVTTNPAKADIQQLAPNLPACTPVAAGGNDAGCTLAAPTTNPVPATVILVKPRSTT